MSVYEAMGGRVHRITLWEDDPEEVSDPIDDGALAEWSNESRWGRWRRWLSNTLRPSPPPLSTWALYPTSPWRQGWRRCWRRVRSLACLVGLHGRWRGAVYDVGASEDPGNVLTLEILRCDVCERKRVRGGFRRRCANEAEANRALRQWARGE